MLPIHRRDYLKATGGLAGASAAGAANTVPGAAAAPTDDRTAMTDTVTPTDLRVEHASEPLGVDAERPRLSWRLTSVQRGQRQTAYRVLVATSRASLDAGSGTVWDSGRIESDATSVAYDGPALDPTTRYYWTVRAWGVDSKASAWSDPAAFETGLLDEVNWTAEWVGRPGGGRNERPGLDWTDYSFEATFEVVEHAVGFVFRARDADNLYMWQVNTRRGPPTLLRPHVRDNGTWRVLDAVDIGDLVPVDSGGHRIRIEAVGNEIRTSIDGTQVHAVTDDTHDSGTVGFRHDASEHARFDDVHVETPAGDVLFAEDFSDPVLRTFEAGRVVDGALDLAGGGVVLRGSPTDRNPEPLLRTEFTAEKSVVRARAHVAGLGFHELYVNGERVGDRVLDSAQTDYEHTVLYSTYDVTDHLLEGANAVGVALGRARYGETAGNVWNWDDPPWWSEPEARVQLEVEFADGTATTVGSDADWRVADGPTRANSLFAGELYDVRTERPGWTTPGFDDADWDAAEPVAGPAGALTAQSVQPIREADAVTPVERTEPEPGVFVFDVGEMVAGWTELTVSGPAGTTVTLTMGEKLHGDGTVNNANGLIFEPMQTDRYVLSGDGEETWEPKYSYKGFRYVQVEGYPGEPTLDDLRAKVLHTEIEAGVESDFDTSNDLLGEIHGNTRRALLNNHHSVPTDTPTYEKNGWTADAFLTAETAIFNFGMARFYEKWLRDIRDAVEDAPEVIGEKGAVPVIVPTSDWGYAGWTPDPAWQSAYVLVAWWTYQYYGDERVLAEHYEGMKTFLAYLERHADDHVIRQGLGDWVSPGGGAVPPEGPGIVSTAYFYRDAELMAEIAAVLGNESDAAAFDALAADIREAFNDAFFDANEGIYRTGNVSEYRQTSNVFPLAFDLVPESHREAVVDNLVTNVTETHDGHLDTGAHGTKYLLPVLTEHGHHDVAYTVATQTTYPSWGHWIEHGMTALLEFWALDARSRDHHFLGTVDEWFYKYLAGVRGVEPGFDSFTVKPHVPDDLDSAGARTDTVNGPVEARWEQGEDGALSLDVTVPVNATATVHVPAAYRRSVVEGAGLALQAPGVSFRRMEDGYAVFEVGSGEYDFAVDPVLGRIGHARELALETDDDVSEYESTGHLGRSAANHLHARLSKLVDWTMQALRSRLDGDDDRVADRVSHALTTVNQIRRWLDERAENGELSPAVASDLDDSLAAVDHALSTDSAALLDVLTTLSVDEPVRAGGSATVTAVVRNGGDENVNDVSVAVDAPDGWTLTPTGGTHAGVVKPGEEFTATFEASVPVSQPPEQVTLAGEASYRHVGGVAELPVATTARVGAPVSVTAVTADPDTVEPGEPTRVTATLRNHVAEPISGAVEVNPPEGWSVDPASQTYRVGATGETTASATVAPPAEATRDGVVAVAATYGGHPADGGRVTVGVDAPATVVDGFEDGDLAEYAGHVDQFSVTTDAPVASGSYSLKVGGDGPERKISSTSGLASYPSAGNLVTYDFQLGTADDALSFVFGAQSDGADPANRYDLNLHAPSRRLLLYRIENGGAVQLAATSAPVGGHADEWLRGEVDWGADGTIIGRLYDADGTELAALSAIDDSFTAGGVGFRSNPTDASPGVVIDRVQFR